MELEVLCRLRQKSILFDNHINIVAFFAQYWILNSVKYHILGCGSKNNTKATKIGILNYYISKHYSLQYTRLYNPTPLNKNVPLSNWCWRRLIESIFIVCDALLFAKKKKLTWGCVRLAVSFQWYFKDQNNCFRW